MNKILLLLMVLTMGAFTAGAQVLIENNEGTAVFTYGPASGLINGSNHNGYSNTQYTAEPAVNNPVPGGINTSAKVGRFNRFGVQYPFLKCKLPGTMTDANAYFTGTKQMSLKLWTDAPIGTWVEITLAKSGNGYPTGQHSTYSAFTTVSMAWETLTFTFNGGTPDGGATAGLINLVDEFNISFAQNSPGNTNVYYFDDLTGPLYNTVAPPVNVKEFLWTDFNGVDPVTYSNSDGTYTPNFANPAQGPNHLLATVGKYDRSTTTFDVFALNVPEGSLQNVGDYITGASKFSLNVYSPAPGTTVSLTLQNRGRSNLPYPTGRFAAFNGVTAGTGWERVILTYAGALNGCLESEINVAAIQFNSNTNTAITVLVDSLHGPTISAGPGLGENVIDNFEATRRITYRPAQSNGTFTDVVANPSILAPNTSTTVGQYVRNNAVQFDVLVGDLNGTINNAAAYVANTKKVTLKVYTTAPVGTIIELTFATAAANSSNYPTGRHSVFRTHTTAQNAWQTLNFTYFFNPNSGADINQLQKIYLAFAANSFTNATWYFDDLQGPSLTPLVLAVDRDRLWSSLGGASNSLYYTGADGVTTQASNPAVGPTNSQPTVAKYVRSTTQYDVLRWKLNAPPTNFALYRSGANKFSINVYATQPTNVQFTLQNATSALAGYPTGRAAEFLGAHTGTGWEHVVLNYAGQPDGGVTDANINELAVLFNANSFASKTIYCDSIFGPQFNAVAASYSSLQWKGSGSTDWNTASNWNGQIANWFPGTVAGPGAVPTASDVVIIPSGATPYPSIAGPYSCGALTVSGVNGLTVSPGNALTVNGTFTMTPGATATVGAGSTLTVTGNLVGGVGSSITGGGVVQVTGNANQNVLGTMNVPNFTLNKNGGGLRLNVGNTLRITPSSASSGILNLSGTSYLGNFAPVQNGGRVILGSNASGTAKLLISGTATYDGVVTQERYIGNVGWHFVSLPFVAPFIGPNIGTLSDFNEAAVRIAPKNNANIFEYTEPDTTRGIYNYALVERNGWKVPNDLNTTYSSTKGYRLYCSPTFIGGSGGVLSTTGTPSRNNINLNFTFSPTTGFGGGGWNLVANPYSCEIDWSAIAFDVVGGNATAPLEKAISIWNPALNLYTTFTATDATTGIGVNGGTQIIASSQAFFVKASATNQILVREVHKVTNAGNSFLRQGAQANVLRFTVKQGTATDEAALSFHANASADDDNMDASNLATDVDMASVSTSGKSLAINMLSFPQGAMRVPLNVNAAIGTASITFTGIETFETGTQFYLVDNFTGTRTSLAASPAVTFNITADPATEGAGRFEIVIVPARVTSVDVSLAAPALNVYPSPTSGAVTVSLNTGTVSNVLVYNALGQVVMQKANTAGSVTLSTESLTPGVYTVKASYKGGVLVKSFVRE